MKTFNLIALFFAGSALASTHHNCGCTSHGNYDVDLSRAACALWGSNQPNTHFDGYSGTGRGIDGQPWENTCKQSWDVSFGGIRNDAWGRCWH